MKDKSSEEQSKNTAFNYDSYDSLGDYCQRRRESDEFFSGCLVSMAILVALAALAGIISRYF